MLNCFDTIASEQEHIILCFHNIDLVKDQPPPGDLVLACLQRSPVLLYRSTGASDENRPIVVGFYKCVWRER